MTLPEAPALTRYRTWTDEEGFHARLLVELPESAIRYGCLQEIWARTELELTQEAVRNQVRVWAWETAP
jgi:hypothetical protein